MVSRRQLLRGQFNAHTQNEIRPPWAKDEALFIDLCSRCGDCITACPEGIISTGSGKFPTVDFRQGECTFCHQCAEVCQHDAFHKNTGPWNIVANIKDNCLSKIGVICQSCAEVCDHRAIKFKLQVGGVPSISLDTQQCTGCGACIHTCPKNAITPIQK